MRCLRDRTFLFAAVLFAACPLHRIHAEDGAPVTAASELMQVFDIILENHVSPPTRQQMVHDSIRELYRQQKQVVPASIAGEISASRDRAELHSILSCELQRFAADEEGYHPHRLAPHGVVLTPTKAHLVNQQLAANRYVGIGISIMDHGTDCPTMFRIVPGGAADQSGSKKGDEIVEVAGNQTRDAPLAQVIDWIRGPEGTDVEIVLRRGGRNMRVTMTRGVVPIKTVKPPVVSESGRTIGISFERISASNVHELKKIEASLDSETRTVVLDFRLNTGARELHYGELLADALIDNAEIGTIVQRDGTTRAIRAEPGALFKSQLVHVLINERTGPVLKWIAAALQENGQVSVIGAPATQPAVVAESITIPARTLTVTVPNALLARRDGELLSPVTGVFGQLSGAFPGVISSRVAAPPINPIRPTRGRVAMKVPGVVYPDQAIFHRFLRSHNGSRTPAITTGSKLIQIVEEIDGKSVAAPDHQTSRDAES